MKRVFMKPRKIVFLSTVSGLVLFLIISTAVNNRDSSVFSQAEQDKFRAKPEIGEYIDKHTLNDLRFIELQISAVTIDMYRYLGWFFDEKHLTKKASIKAVDDLNNIKEHLKEMHCPKSMVKLKYLLGNIIDSMVDIYDGIELKTMEDIDKCLTEMEPLYSQCSEELRQEFREHKSVQELSDDTNFAMQAEIATIRSSEDKKTYLDAVRLLKERKFSQAYTSLKYLEEKYKNTPFVKSIHLRMSDCMINCSPVEYEKLFDPEKGIELLSGILDEGRYSPVLYKAFYEWRTFTQEFWHGMSNLSEIPNQKYNKKRRDVIQTIEEHIKEHPDDTWAQTQMNSLLSLPNINRGSYFGNSNIINLNVLR